jgi:hypothetical protein
VAGVWRPVYIYIYIYVPRFYSVTRGTIDFTHIPQSQYHWATVWTIRVLGFDSRRRLGIFLFTIAFRTALRPTQPPIQWVPGALSLDVKRSGREAYHSHLEPRSKKATPLSNMPSWRGAQLKKHRDIFTFTTFSNEFSSDVSFDVHFNQLDGWPRS